MTDPDPDEDDQFIVWPWPTPCSPFCQSRRIVGREAKFSIRCPHRKRTTA